MIRQQRQVDTRAVVCAPGTDSFVRLRPSQIFNVSPSHQASLPCILIIQDVSLAFIVRPARPRQHSRVVALLPLLVRLTTVSSSTPIISAYPLHLVLHRLLYVGAALPRAAASLGAIWVAGRVVYTQGYRTGNPAKRNAGAFGTIGFLGLMGTAAYLSVKSFL